MNILPIGSVIYLNNGLKKVMIVGRKMIRKEDGNKYYDYGAVLYPEGLVSEELVFFNEENISKTVYLGFIDEDEDELNRRLVTWASETTLERCEVAEKVEDKLDV